VNFGWTTVPFTELVAQVVERAANADRPVLVAVDGHGSSGKSTLAARLACALPGAHVLHTDDLAWRQGVFAWDTLLRDDVLPVVLSGAALDYRPPQWRFRRRPGSIRLPAGMRFLLVEGVGASQPSVRAAYDMVIWVETDEPTRLARDAPRLAAGEISAASYANWMVEENAYTTRERPWQHADLIVYGGDSIPHDTTAVVLGDTSRQEPSA
jgi:hypothetical protein